MSDLQQRMAEAAAKLGLPDEDEPKKDNPYLIKDEQLEHNWEEGWRRYESGYYFDDENHSGQIYVSQKMVDKYNLCGEMMDAKWLEEALQNCYAEEDEDSVKELQSKYAQEIYIIHAIGYSPEGCSSDHRRNCVWNTAHGDIGSENFVAWWNDFPVELLKEAEDDVYIAGWCDG